MAKGTPVGTIRTEHLAKLLGAEVTISRTSRTNPKYPLYLSTTLGPIFLNTKSAQEMCLQSGVMFSNEQERAQVQEVSLVAANDETFVAQEEPPEEPPEAPQEPPEEPQEPPEEPPEEETIPWWERDLLGGDGG